MPFCLYRESPFRCLYRSGLGFQEPPTRQFLSQQTLAQRRRWHIWVFDDHKLASQFAKQMSRNEPTRVAPIAVTRHQKAPRRINQPAASRRRTTLEELA